MLEKNTVLRVNGLTKIFDETGFFQKKDTTKARAVNSISFSLYEGEIVGLLGSNGSGKTTTLQMLIGALLPTEGTIEYFGKNFFTNRSEIMQHISFASSSIQLPALLTVSQNLDIYGRLYGMNASERAQRIEEVLKALNLYDVRLAQTGSLSTGQLTRVALAKAFLTNPRVLLLDEPTAPLDPEISHEVRRFILEQRQRFKTTILLSSHNMFEVAEMCNRVIVMKHGSIVVSDTPQALQKKIAKTRLQFILGDAISTMENFLKARSLSYLIDNQSIKVEVEESIVAEFFKKLAAEDIMYTHVSIEKPTLEDYFLTLSGTTTYGTSPTAET